MQGVGSFFDGAKAPRPSSFKDGVFGAPQATEPGALMSFQDGSLGSFFEADDAATPRSFQDGSLGSYFDGMARPPRPEGYALQGKLMAYQDGTFGRHVPDSEGPGKEQAFEGGIFHALGLPLFIDGNKHDGPLTIQHGTPSEGDTVTLSLPEYYALKDGGGPAVATPTEHLGFPEGSPRSYMDGSLGPESGFIAEGLPSGPLMAFDEGVLGRGHIPMSGLGFWDKSSGDTFVIDMTDKQWVKELKAALVMSLTSLGITEPLNTLDEDWYVSPFWNGKATGMTREWAGMFQEKINPAASTGLLIRDTGKLAYPTVTGIVQLVSTGVGVSADFNATSFPKLYAFMQEVAKAGEGGLDRFVIVPPFASEGDKIRKGGIMSVTNVSLMVMGGVGLAAVGFIAYNLLRK